MDILVIDEHALLRDGLRLLLRPLAKDLNIFDANTLVTAIQILAEKTRLDLILLEIGTPGVDGAFGVRELRARAPSQPIVVLGAPRRRDEVLAAIDAGANGYIPRAAGARILLSALELVLAGEVYIPSLVLVERTLGASEHESALAPHLRGSLARLTKRQRDVLHLLAQGHSNAAIAEGLDIELNTVKNHIKSILKTLGASNRTEAVVKAVDLGFRSANLG